MEFLISAVISGLIYDCAKKGIELTVYNIFKNYFSIEKDSQLYIEINKLIDEIKKHNDVEISKQIEQVLLKNESFKLELENEMYKTNFAKRLDYILTLVNQCNNDEMTREELAYKIGLETADGLNCYYKYNKEPGFEFVKIISDFFGVNNEWFIYGKGNPFISKMNLIEYPDQIINDKEFANIKEILIASTDNISNRQVCIICYFGGYRYSYFPKRYIFNSNVGACGQSRLFSFYELLISLKNTGLYPNYLCKLSEDTFDKLLEGKLYPGAVKYISEHDTTILDDFINLHNSHEGKIDNYLKWYGEDFIKCQNIVESMIKSK